MSEKKKMSEEEYQRRAKEVLAKLEAMAARESQNYIPGWSWPKRPKKDGGQAAPPDRGGKGAGPKRPNDKLQEALAGSIKTLREAISKPVPEKTEDDGRQTMEVIIGYKRPPKKAD
jgi:hypothetical protein